MSNIPTITRRNTLKLVAGAALSAPMVIRARAETKQIVVRDSGGPFTPAFEAAFYKPFREATGIEVIPVTSSHEPTAQIKGMVDTGTYTWNLAHLSFSAVEQLSQEGDYLEKHELDKAEFVNEIPSNLIHPYAVGSDIYAMAIASRTDIAKPVKTWADIWDVKGFPGRRSLRRFPFGTIEGALLADGVKAEDLYPLDFDRAFKKLDEIKGEIVTWWTGGAQVTQMLVGGEVDIIPSMNARLQAAIDEGAPVEISWAQNLYEPDGWAILKGTPMAEECRQFIQFCSAPERQAAFTPMVANGPTNPNAYKFIPEKRARMLPTFKENLAQGIQTDVAFLSANKDVAVEKFNNWLLG